MDGDSLMASFPELSPTSSEFTGPSFSVRSTVSLSGVTSRRIFGNRAYGAALSLSFDNITNDNATLIFECWSDSYGQLLEVTLPDSIYDGAGPNLAAYIKSVNGGVKWHFAEQPSLTRGVPGYSSVSVRLEASLDA